MLTSPWSAPYAPSRCRPLTTCASGGIGELPDRAPARSRPRRPTRGARRQTSRPAVGLAVRDPHGSGIRGGAQSPRRLVGVRLFQSLGESPVGAMATLLLLRRPPEAGSRWVSIHFPCGYTQSNRPPASRSICNECFTTPCDTMREPPLDETDAPDPRRGALIGLGVVLALIVVGLIVTHLLRNTARVQDCVMSGRTNCAPIDTSSSDSHGSN